MSDSEDLLDRWGIPPPADLTRTACGMNNDTRLVLDGDRRNVLRRYQNLSAAQAVREHRMLTSLSTMDLPFAVPQPLAARDGSTVVLSDSGPAALFAWIPGEQPDPRTASDWERIGAAGGKARELSSWLDQNAGELREAFTTDG